MPRLRAALLLAALRAAAPSPLRVAAALATEGAAGFVSFEIDAERWLFAANFWDGASSDMSADSVFYTLPAPSPSGALAPRAAQRVRGRGAHGAAHLATAKGAHYVIVPFYYDCGTGDARGEVAEDAACRATRAYRYDRARGAWALAQSLATAGPAAAAAFTARDGEHFAAVGENFADLVSLWRLVRASSGAERFERAALVRGVPGAGAVAIFEAGDRLTLVAASYHDASEGGWATRTRVYAADANARGGAAPDFREIARLATSGAHGAAAAALDGPAGAVTLLLAEDRGPGGPRVNSSLWEFGAAGGPPARAADLPSDGAHGGALFAGPRGDAFALVANFGDRLGGRVAARSDLWRRRRGARAWALAASVDTAGATDAHFFAHGGRAYVALACEGDVGRRAAQESRIYEVVDEGEAAAEL